MAVWALVFLLVGGELAWAEVVEQLGDGATRLLETGVGSPPEPAGRGRLPLPDELTLPAQTGAALQQMRAEHGPNWLGPTRPLPAEINGLWALTPKGKRVWRVTIRASGVRALRVHFDEFSVDGSVWLYGDEWSGPQVGPYRNSGPHQNGSFWSEFVFNETVTVEYVPDDSTASEQVPFRIRSVAQIMDDWFPAPGGHGKPDGWQPRAIAGCHLDVSCYPSLQRRDRPSVAKLYITKENGTSFCTGFLINPSYKSDNHLLFLTAAHCISTQEVAQDTSFLWDYQTEACYGNPNWRQWAEPLAFTYGGSLVVSKHDRYDDFALLALSKAKVRRATGWIAEGWNTRELRNGDWVSTVGHPDGSFKRAAFGRVLDFDWEGNSSLGFGTIRWWRGTSEPGSSGSPVFRGTGETRRVVGVVSGSNRSSIDEESPWGQYCDVALRVSFNRLDHIYKTIEPYMQSEERLLAVLGIADDHGNHWSRATSLALGASVSGYIDSASDVDYFRVEVSQRTRTKIFTTGSLDTIGSLRDNSDRVLRGNDDSGESLNFLIEETLERGTSYIRVSSFNGSTGRYTLHVKSAGRVATVGHTYEPLNGWLVSHGSVRLRVQGVSTIVNGGCGILSMTVNGNRYEFHTSKWQWRSGPGRAWVDIRGSAQGGYLVCSYSPTQSGEYRIVGEISINGERGNYSSENTIWRP